ncbi:hypothetical protein HAX54_030335, partial [Datura stramonium]|nr:hypothetical protein [Datura stramonium]
PPTDAYLVGLENMNWHFICGEKGDKPILEMEKGRHLTYSGAICIGDYIPDMS